MFLCIITAESDVRSRHAQVPLTVACWRALHMADVMAVDGLTLGAESPIPVHQDR